MTLHTLLIVCEPGLHALQLAELKNLDYNGAVVNATSVRVENTTDDDVVRLNYLLRQALGVYVVLWEGAVDTLDDIRQAGSEADYAMWLDPKQSFRVEADRFGEHTFRSPQIAGAIGQRIVNQFMDRCGVRVRADLDHPEVRFHALLYDEHLVISVNTSGDHLRDRHPRVYRHRSSLRPSIAAAMIGLSSFGKGRSLFDPMAGGGTLPTEACFIKKGIPAGAFRTSYAFEKLVNFDSGSLKALREVEREAVWGDDVQIGACDRSVKALAGMRQNFEAQGLVGEIDHWEDDAEHLRKLDTGRFQIMISNPSYGIWNGSLRLAHQTYERVPKVAADKGIDEIVMVTPDDDWLIACAEKAGYRLMDRIPFMHGDLENRMIRFTLDASDGVLNKETRETFEKTLAETRPSKDDSFGNKVIDKVVKVQQTVPFLWVTDVAKSVAFYVDGLGFKVNNKWEPDGKLRWCWLQHGGAALMLQEDHENKPILEKRGAGVKLHFICEDAKLVYQQAKARGLEASDIEVGNGLDFTDITDPDGYKLCFESPTVDPDTV